jgi:hypothetical protein
VAVVKVGEATQKKKWLWRRMLIVNDSRVVPSADWERLLREPWWYQKGPWLGFRAEPQWIVATRPLCHLQYPVPSKSSAKDSIPAYIPIAIHPMRQLRLLLIISLGPRMVLELANSSISTPLISCGGNSIVAYLEWILT